MEKERKEKDELIVSINLKIKQKLVREICLLPIFFVYEFN